MPDFEGQSFQLPTEEPEPEQLDKLIIEKLFSKQDINFKTDLTDREIKILTRLSVLSELLNMKQLASLVKVFKEMRVSKNRLGRRELVDVMKGYEEQQRERNMDKIKNAFGINR